MPTIITLNPFSNSSIESAIQQLERYRDSITWKCEEFVAKLAEAGLIVAKNNSANSIGTIVFDEIKTMPTETGCTAVMRASSSDVQVTWYINAKGDEKTEGVSPLLMAEFGSGSKAINGFGIAGVGQGTFPPDGHGSEGKWAYKDENGWHTSTGFTPTQPMMKALNEIYSKVDEIAMEVFGGA